MASVATLRGCSGSSWNAVRLRRNPQLLHKHHVSRNEGRDRMVLAGSGLCCNSHPCAQPARAHVVFHIGSADAGLGSPVAGRRVLKLNPQRTAGPRTERWRPQRRLTLSHVESRRRGRVASLFVDHAPGRVSAKCRHSRCQRRSAGAEILFINTATHSNKRHHA
jgi:hypothetical protein